MKKALLSFGFGNQAKLLNIALPTFHKYANIHNYDLIIPSENFFSHNTKQRHYSWWKIELISRTFQSYDKILWIDADVVVCDFSKDIMDDLSTDSHVGMVVHDVPEGLVPNCGVWTLDKKCTIWFDGLWECNNLPRSNVWWEQTAMLHKLGIDTSARILRMPDSFSIPWTQLDYLWNPHAHDKRGIPLNMRFFHSTMFKDRAEAMKHILSRVNI